MQLYIIRHCQSANNALWRRTRSSNGRSSDPDLTELGRQQAVHLAQYLGSANGIPTPAVSDPLDRTGIAISHLYCSLMSRSIETGLAIAKHIDIPLIARLDIHERGGIYLDDPITDERNGLPGPNREYFNQQFPDLVLPESVGEDGWWNRPYEDSESAVSRARNFLKWLVAAHDGTDDRVAIVTHGGFIQSLFTALFEVPSSEKNLGSGRRIWLSASNGSITRIDFFEDSIRLAYQNRVEFLPAELIT